MSKPEQNEYPEWSAGEIELVHYDNLLHGLEDSLMKTLDFLKNIQCEKLEYRYEDGKWTIKQIWQHVLDVERILCYRALCYSRQDTNVLPGFDGKNYVELSLADLRKWDDMIMEYMAVRTSTIWLFKSFTPDMLMHRGITGKSTMTVRALGYLILGHELHHTNTIKTKYLDLI